MKRFLGRSKKAEETSTYEYSGELYPVVSPPQSLNTAGSQDSIRDLKPIFAKEGDDKSLSGFQFTNDPNLNLNPSILNTPTHSPLSLITKDSNLKSIFSQSKRTYSTKHSSNFSQRSSKDGQDYNRMEYGQPLQILDVVEESKDEIKLPTSAIADKLHELYDDLSFIWNKYRASLDNLSLTIINCIESFKRFVSFVNKVDKQTYSWHFTTYNNSNLRKIMKIYLNFYDNLLDDEVYFKLKLMLVKNFIEFANVLDSAKEDFKVTDGLIKPQNFAIGINKGKSLPREDFLSKIIDRIANSNASMKEQNGSFIAPIARGISKELNVLCLYFGYPNPTEYHYKLVKHLLQSYEDIHVMIVKNKIELASNSISGLNQQDKVPQLSANAIQKFKLPFRICNDIEKPPISLSLSIENSIRTSGTLGGYIYPIIDSEKQPQLKSYLTSKFAISCGHVCLDSKDEYVDYPHVCAPLSVLISLYKQALWSQYQRVSKSNTSVQTEAKVAYGSVLKEIDEMFPARKVKVVDSVTHEERYEMRNLPIHRFGQIIWGERTLVGIRKENETRDVEKRLSDLAIIKINKNLKCDQNFLGDDIAFNEFDPALMFDNLYVRAVVNLSRDINSLDLKVDEVDSEVPKSNSNNGLPVFKYGSTTKFTKGNLNGIKLVYWLDGSLHSSEFVINSIENNTAFAAGGDSGSWILTKLEDCDSINESKGLGVVGMLHSYDGEHKQFGLFMPMCEILERLEEVTKIKWGVVGVPEKDVSRYEDNVSSSEENTDYSDLPSNYSSESESEGEYESGKEDLEEVSSREID